MAMAEAELLPRRGLFAGQPLFDAANRWPPAAAFGATLVILAASFGAGLLSALVVKAALGSVVEADGAYFALTALVGTQLAAVVLTLLAARAFSPSPAAALAWRPVARIGVYVSAFALMLVGVALLGALSWLVDHSSVEADLAPFRDLARSDAWWLALFAASVGAPLMEELLFRGFLMTALSRSRLGFVGASLISSALWTGLHVGYSPPSLVAVFLVGLYFSWLVWRTGSLKVPLVCHGIYNLVVVLIVMLVDIPGLTQPAVG
ncbi:MAG: lysostaphin resistance A-like protein [Hyphomicrobiaceae bacterium]